MVKIINIEEKDNSDLQVTFKREDNAFNIGLDAKGHVNGTGYKIVENGKIAGYGIVTEDNEIQFVIKDAFRKKGYSIKLIKFMESEIKGKEGKSCHAVIKFTNKFKEIILNTLLDIGYTVEGALRDHKKHATTLWINNKNVCVLLQMELDKVII
ncbi:MAG: hypothetical protein ACOCUT_00895 [bacterium]